MHHLSIKNSLAHGFFLFSRRRGVMLLRDRSDIVKDYVFANCFFFYSASEYSDRTIAGRVVSTRYIMVQHGFISKKRVEQEKISTLPNNKLLTAGFLSR